MGLGNSITILLGLGFVAAGLIAYSYLGRFLGTGVRNDPEHVEIGTLAGLRRFRVIVAATCAVFGLVVCSIGVGLELGLLDWPTPRRRG